MLKLNQTKNASATQAAEDVPARSVLGFALSAAANFH